MKKFIKITFIITVLSLVLFPIYLNDSSNKTDNQKLYEEIPKPIPTTIQNNEDNCSKDAPTFYGQDSTEDGWELIWKDKFDNNCLDLSKWNTEDWAAEKNNELQYYSPNNVKVEEGVLKLISKKERYKGREYTSGAVHTKGKFDFLYGKVEMRAKLPAGQGIFPAFWMITDNEDTWLPEIDILEMLGHQPGEIWMVSHWLGEDGKLKSDFSSFKGQDFSKDFHTYSIEWTPDSITWFIDGVERFKSTKYIPSEKMYLYLNTAVGGKWPGPPDETTVFPAIYEIDYVKVFKRNKE